MNDVLPWLGLLPFGWLLFVEPALADRRRERREARNRAQRRDLDLMIVRATQGREGLERVLARDLLGVLAQRRLAEDPAALVADVRAGRGLLL